ncbi:MAG: ATP-dependent DNA ligase [Gaiellaceae bacterium]
MATTITPMLARLARELPVGDYLYEPKWDGFRCLAFREGGEVDLRSRNGRPLARYFPEVVEALLVLPEGRFVLDGELVVAGEDALDFLALMARLHPAASRVERLREETPASFVAFDLVAAGGEDLAERPFAQRRARLEQLVGLVAPPLALTPVTADVKVARAWLDRFEGVVAKHRELRYEPGRRVMVKVKHERTADCVVAGFRWLVERPLPSSLLLGLYDDGGELRHVGVAAGFSEALRRELLDRLAPLAVPLEGHTWEQGFRLPGSPTGRLKGSAGSWIPGEMEQDWVPVAPELVAEVAYDQLDGHRFRHAGRFQRWRPDRDAQSCRVDQLEAPAADLAELLP